MGCMGRMRSVRTCGLPSEAEELGTEHSFPKSTIVFAQEKLGINVVLAHLPEAVFLQLLP